MRKYIMAITMTVTLVLSGATVAQAWDGQPGDDHSQPASCQIQSSVIEKLQAQLAAVVKEPDKNGGLFSPNRMWSAIVDRVGTLCSVIVTGDAWPGSRAIAIAKATTANGFSNDALALSTANLYGPTQPGGSLYGLNDFESVQPAVPATRDRHRLCSGWYHYIRGRRRALLRRQSHRRTWRQRRHILCRPRDFVPDAPSCWPGRHA